MDSIFLFDRLFEGAFMPISDCDVRDPRIRRTRQMLQMALRTLMLTRSFDEISVQDITEAATISRATFYDHYTDKYTLLGALVAGGFHALIAERGIRYAGPGSEGPLIQAVCDYMAEAQDAGNCERQNPFEPLVGAAIMGAIQKALLVGMTEQDKLAATAASYAIYGAARDWVMQPQRRPVKEIVAVMQAMVRPILAAEQKKTAAEPAAHGR
jgi:AcrR family transcriptional regulator